MLVFPNINNNICDSIWLDNFTTHDLNEILYDQQTIPRYLHCATPTYIENLPDVLDEIRPILVHRLITPIAKNLQQLGYQQAILIPCGTLGLLPLHSVADQTVVFSVSPSARALQTAYRKSQTVQSPSLLGIANPLPNDKPLAFASLEVNEIAPLFQGSKKLLYEHNATYNAVRDHLPGKTYLHLSCHGVFDPNAPLNSALSLAKQESLTLRDLLDSDFDVSTVRLVILSACQTGMIDFQNVPDETIGFPTGFLQAGVQGVISTLWPVEDISTALLLVRFYHYHLKKGWAPAKALMAAQNGLQNATVKELGLVTHYQKMYLDSKKTDREALRNKRYYEKRLQDKPFAHPYYWAGFVFSGVGL